MKLFKCQSCGQVLYFDNTACERCSHRLGYLSNEANLTALEPVGEYWRTLGRPSRQVRFCENADYGACNWLLDEDAFGTVCAACRYNRTIPDLSVPGNLGRWRQLESAKHWLIYSLLRLRLPLKDRQDDPENGLAFDFLADGPSLIGPRVLTGHENGIITIALAEADDAERERRRTQFGEPYRSLLGHFRHEVGHHYWHVLVRNGTRLEEYRAIFGDDRQGYRLALDRHYRNGAPTDWQEHYVSAYATTHPWEDWAETWAHYLHIIDTLEMAAAFGIRIRPDVSQDKTMATSIDFDSYATDTVEEIIEAWLPLTFAVNSLNRTMGNRDLYPFVLSPAVFRKLAFIHRVVHGKGGSQQLLS